MTLAHGICVLLIINYATEVTPCLKCALKTLKENFLVGRKCAFDGYIKNDHVSSVGTNNGPCGNKPKYSSEESQWKEEFSDEKSVVPTSLKKIRISKDGKDKIITSQKQGLFKLYINRNTKSRKPKWRGGTIQSDYQSSETEYKMEDLPKIKILGSVSNDEEFVKEINTNKKRKNNKLLNEKPNKRIGYEYQIKEKQSKQSSRDLQSNKLEGLEGKSTDDGEYRQNLKNFGKSELIENGSNYKECTKLSKGPCKMITSEMKEDSRDTHIEFISNDQPDQYKVDFIKDLKQQESQLDDVNNKNMRTESRIEAQSQHEIETHNSRNETLIHNNVEDKHQEANSVDLVLKEQGNESHGEKKHVFELEESHHEDKHKESESHDAKTVEIEHKVYNHEDLDHKGGETESQSYQNGTNSQVSYVESQKDQKQENESLQQKNQAQEESATSQDTHVKSQDQEQQEIESRRQEDVALEGKKTATHEDQYHIKQTISQGVHVQSQDQEHQETESHGLQMEDDKKKAADFKKGESESSNNLQSQNEVVIEPNESKTEALAHKENQNENLDLNKSDIKSKGEQKRKFKFPRLTIRKRNETKTQASQAEFQVRKEEASESQFELHTEKNNLELNNLELLEGKKVDTQEGMGVLRVDAHLKDQEHQEVEHIVTKNNQTIGSHSAAESESITVVNKKKRNRSGSKGTKSFESQDKQATLELENNEYQGFQQYGSKGYNKKKKIHDMVSSDSVESNEYLGMNRGSYSTNKNFNSQTYTKGQSDYHKRIDQLEDRSFHKKGFKYMSAHGIYIVSTEQTCRKNPCGMHANCRSEEGRAVCFCQFGTFGNPLVSCQPGSCTRNEQCDDHLACVDGQCMDLCHKSCGINAVCKMRNHQPVCKCLLGYVGNPHVECTYKEICSPNPCGANTVCKSVEGKPVCLCAPGYQGDPLIACRHECEHDTDCARNQACRDFTCQDACVLCGKYADCKSVAVHKPVCQCPKNYYGNPYVACKPECTDHSECPRNKPTCHQFKCKNPCDGACGVLAECAISGVEAVCTCPEHLTGNPLVLCRPYERKDFCEPSPCGMNSRCELGVDDYGKYMAVCNCQPGFYKRNNGACLPGDCEDHFHCPDHKACIDFMCDDPCIGECGTNSFCEPHNHTAVCSCMPGFEGNPVLGCTKQIKCTTQTFCAGRIPMKLLKGK